MTNETDWPLLCPDCSIALAAPARQCSADCPRRSPDAAGVWDLLPSADPAGYSGFLERYQEIRAEEGYTARGAEYYRALPQVPDDDPWVQIWRMRQQSFACLAKMLALWAPQPARILDLGSGNGWLSHRLSLLGHQLLALDINMDPDDGLQARRHFDANWVSVRAGFHALPLPDACADIAIFNGSFHYGTQQGEALAEAARVLRPGGRVVILDSPIYRSGAAGTQMLTERGMDADAGYDLGFLTWAQLRTLGRGAGLRLSVHHPAYGLRWRARRVLQRVWAPRETAGFALLSYRKKGMTGW